MTHGEELRGEDTVKLDCLVAREKVDRILWRDPETGAGASTRHLTSAAEYYIVNNNRRAFVIDGTSIHRTEVPEIPMAAVREALLNALCHRVYETNAAVQVDIYWDRVDIYSPGPFPAGVSPEAYLSGGSAASNPRNYRIVQTLYRSVGIEAYGTGLQLIKRACDGQGMPVEFFERAK